MKNISTTTLTALAIALLIALPVRAQTIMRQPPAPNSSPVGAEPAMFTGLVQSADSDGMQGTVTVRGPKPEVPSSGHAERRHEQPENDSVRHENFPDRQELHDHGRRQAQGNRQRPAQWRPGGNHVRPSSRRPASRQGAYRFRPAEEAGYDGALEFCNSCDFTVALRNDDTPHPTLSLKGRGGTMKMA